MNNVGIPSRLDGGKISDANTINARRWSTKLTNQLGIAFRIGKQPKRLRVSIVSASITETPSVGIRGGNAVIGGAFAI